MSTFIFLLYGREQNNKIRVKKKYLIDIKKYKKIYCEVFFYREAKSNFVPYIYGKWETLHTFYERFS